MVSLSTSDYTRIDELVAKLAQSYGRNNLSVSLPSLRIDRSSVRLMDSLPRRRTKGLTFAPETGSERLRQAINKSTSEDELLQTAAAAFEQGWTTLKLYFMLGLPTETFDDIEEIVWLVDKVHLLGRQTKGKKPQIRISLSTFVPKPHTPFQWAAQEGEQGLNAKHELLKRELRRRGIKLSWNEPKISLLEAALSRGDRRLGKVIYRAWRLGSTFDAWNERFNHENWLRAFEEAGLEPFFYTRRERSPDELLPWSHINTGVTPAFLKREYRRSIKGTLTPDCSYNACNTCGLERWQPHCRQKCQSKG
jgi:radical SAM superfamily enzyme YgiQ (UPF0313 family)